MSEGCFWDCWWGVRLSLSGDCIFFRKGITGSKVGQSVVAVMSRPQGTEGTQPRLPFTRRRKRILVPTSNTTPIKLPQSNIPTKPTSQAPDSRKPAKPSSHQPRKYTTLDPRNQRRTSSHNLPPRFMRTMFLLSYNCDVTSPHLRQHTHNRCTTPTSVESRQMELTQHISR